MRTVKYVFRRVDMVKSLFRRFVPSLGEGEYCLVLNRVAHKYYKKKVFLSDLEQKVYDLLLANKLHPFTVYRWFLVLQYDEDILLRLKNGELGLAEARRLNGERKEVFSGSVSDQILKQLVKLVKEV